MLTEDEVREIVTEALQEYGADLATITEESGRHVAAKMRAELSRRGADDALLESVARSLIDEFVRLPGATKELVTAVIWAVSDGFGFDARIEREPSGSVRIGLTPRRKN
jgi:hypothetical protein